MKLEDFILEVEELDLDQYNGKYNSDYLGKIVVYKAKRSNYFFLPDGSTHWYIPEELTAMVRTILAQVKGPCQHEEKPFTSPYIETTYTDDFYRRRNNGNGREGVGLRCNPQPSP